LHPRKPTLFTDFDSSVLDKMLFLELPDG
jgi:hypothetical protein